MTSLDLDALVDSALAGEHLRSVDALAILTDPDIDLLSLVHAAWRVRA